MPNSTFAKLNRESTKITISEFYERNQLNKYNFDPEYQRRGDVWSDEKQAFLIDSILKNYPMPPIFLHQVIDSDTGATKYNVIDGKQRLNAILRFIGNEIELPSDYDVGAFGDSRLNGKKFCDLDGELQEFKMQFWRYILSVEYIETDDIVVFDNSDIRRMVLKFREHKKDINLNPNPGLVLPVENDGGEDMTDENTNLWDSIEVEMNAQFDTVKITLGELKNIEEGLVVDLTSIYDNKVTLSVEDKPIARGELVIVNDRYGVKIEEVIAKTPAAQVSADNVQVEIPAQEETHEDETSTVQQQPVQEQTTDEEDEFDYSDFELEDEDI